MASESYPRPGHNSGAVTTLEHERLTHGQAPDGLMGHPDDDPLAYADGTGTRLVKLRAGRFALVRGSQWYSGASDINMTSLSANGSGQPRIDLVVLRLDRADYTVTEAVIAGTPGANPVAPSPTADVGSTGTWDLPVAQVRVESGATSLTSDKVTPVAWYVNDDGLTLCKTTTMPPHQAARRVFQTDTGRLLTSTGTKWLRVGEDSGSPVSLVMSSGFTATNNRVYVRNGWVHMQLTVQRNAVWPAGATYTVATVADGYRPPFPVPTVGVVPSGQSVVTVDVGTGGNVVIAPGATGINANRAVQVSAISWPVA